MIYRDDGIVTVSAPKNIVTIVTAGYLPPVVRFWARKKHDQHPPDRALKKPLRAVCGANRAAQTVGKSHAEFIGRRYGVAAAIFQGRKWSRRKQRHLKASLRLTSDGNADRKTAWLRRFSAGYTFAEIRGCRCTCFRLWRQKRGCKKYKSPKQRRFGQKI